MNGRFEHLSDASAHPGLAPRPATAAEKLTVAHVAALLIFLTWAYGGNVEWARTTAAAWGTLGLFITVHTWRTSPSQRLAPLSWLWPLVLFNLLVAVSCFNPSFRELTDDTRLLYVSQNSHPHLPSTARPWLSLQTLWFFDAVYLSCFNLVLVIRQRRVLRTLLFVLAGNALLLTVFGTVQKLIGATEIFFASGKAVQPYFFASFIYHNHWGAFAVLMVALCLGLFFHFERRRHARDFWHSPGFAGLVAVMLLAASVPLSGSRSCTLLIVLLVTAAFLHWLFRLWKERSGSRRSIAAPAGLALTGVIITGAFAFHFARPVIAQRMVNTYEQIEQVRENPATSTRLQLYRDTWRVAQQKPWFGWGMASFPTVFFLNNSQRFPHPNRPDIEVHYHDAHSDWLQSLAEVGFVGTTLLGLCALVPLYHSRRALTSSPLALYLLGGCFLVALYAWVEFPFGNRAVICAWWISFFVALHYPRLQSRSNPASSSTSTLTEAIA